MWFHFFTYSMKMCRIPRAIVVMGLWEAPTAPTVDVAQASTFPGHSIYSLLLW